MNYKEQRVSGLAEGGGVELYWTTGYTMLLHWETMGWLQVGATEGTGRPVGMRAKTIGTTHYKNGKNRDGTTLHQLWAFEVESSKI